PALAHGPEAPQSLPSLARDFARGLDPDWLALRPSGRCVRLPAYPWQGERHWVEAEVKAPAPVGSNGHPATPEPGRNGHAHEGANGHANGAVLPTIAAPVRNRDDVLADL